MVICFVPGSGGHRYKRYLQDQKFNAHNSNMHTFVSPEYDSYIFIEKSDQNLKPLLQKHKSEIIMTHTMNGELLKKYFPGNHIVKLKVPFLQALERKWQVEGRFKTANMLKINRIDRAFQSIKWHTEYYTRNGIDYDCDTLIDIEIDDSEFSNIMRRQLSIRNDEFQLAMNIFNEHGIDAPVLDILKEQLK